MGWQIPTVGRHPSAHQQKLAFFDATHWDFPVAWWLLKTHRQKSFSFSTEKGQSDMSLNTDSTNKKKVQNTTKTKIYAKKKKKKREIQSVTMSELEQITHWPNLIHRDKRSQHDRPFLIVVWALPLQWIKVINPNTRDQLVCLFNRQHLTTSRTSCKYPLPFPIMSLWFCNVVVNITMLWLSSYF